MEHTRDRPEQQTTTSGVVSLNAYDLEGYEGLFTLPPPSFLESLRKGPTIIVSPAPDAQDQAKNTSIQVFITPTSESDEGKAFLDVGMRRMHAKKKNPKEMGGSTLHQPGETKPLTSIAPSTATREHGRHAAATIHSPIGPSSSKFKPFRDEV